MRLLNHLFENVSLLDDFIQQYDIRDSSRLLIQIFSGELDDVRLSCVISDIADRFMSATIVTATTGGEIMDGKTYDGRVVCSFSEFESTDVRAVLIEWDDMAYASEQCEIASLDVFSDIICTDTRALVILSDGFNPCAEYLLKRVSEIAPDVVIVGGKAWDNLAFEPGHTRIGLGKKLVSRGIVVYSLSGADLRVYADYDFNWLTVGKMFTVTRARGDHLMELDSQPVIEVYKKYLGEHIADDLPQSALEFPIVIHRGATQAARGAIHRYEDWSLLLTGNIEIGDRVQFGCGYREGILDGNIALHNRIIKHPVQGIFTFSCAWRKTFLWEDIAREVAYVGQIAPAAWFFSYSEFFRTPVCPAAMLNYSMVNLCLSESDELSWHQEMYKHAHIQDYLKYALSNIAVSTSHELLSLNTHLLEKIDEKVSEIERTNREHIEAYKKVIDNMHNMAWIWEIHTGRTIYANQRFFEVSGYTQVEVIWQRVDGFYDTDTSVIIAQNRFLRARGEVSTYLGTMVTKNGESVPVEIRGIPFIDGLSVAIIRDLREIRRLETQNKELQELNAAKNDFLNVASHELRTPMTSIKGYLSMILDGDFWFISDDIRETLGGLLKNSERLIRIINDMLDISKLESGKLDFHIANIDLLDCLHDVYREHVRNSIAQEKHLIFELVDAPSLDVLADEDRLRQILANLIGNAFKFTPEWWRVVLSFCIEGDMVRVSVSDSGIGIAPENHEKVFQKFSQIGNTLRRKYEWTGLWLAITRELVERMWGVMSLESVPGSGSTFSFTLPLAK